MLYVIWGFVWRLKQYSSVFPATGAIRRLPQYQWSDPERHGQINRYHFFQMFTILFRPYCVKHVSMNSEGDLWWCMFLILFSQFVTYHIGLLEVYHVCDVETDIHNHRLIWEERHCITVTSQNVMASQITDGSVVFHKRVRDNNMEITK